MGVACKAWRVHYWALAGKLIFQKRGAAMAEEGKFYKVRAIVEYADMAFQILIQMLQ